MKNESNFKATAIRRRWFAALSIALLFSSLNLYSAEDIITDVKDGDNINERHNRVLKLTDVQQLIKLAVDSDEIYIRYAAIKRLGELKEANASPALWSLVENTKIHENIRVLAAESLKKISGPEYFEKILKLAQMEVSEGYPITLIQGATIALCHYDNPKGPELLIKNIKASKFEHEGLLVAFDILKAEDVEKFKAALIQNAKSIADKNESRESRDSRLSAIYLLACQPKPDDKSIDALIHAAIHEKNEYVRGLIFCIMTGERKHFDSFMSVPTNFIGVKDAKDKLIAAIPKFEKSVDSKNSFIFAEVCRLFALIEHPDALAALIRLANSNHKDASLAKKAIYMNPHADARNYFADRIRNKKISSKERIGYLNALNLETYNGKLEMELPKDIADAILEVVRNEKNENKEVRKWAILNASYAQLPVVDYVVSTIKTAKDPDYKRKLIYSLKDQQNETSLAFIKELIGKEKDANERWLAIYTAYYLCKWMHRDKDLAAIYETVAYDESLWLRAQFLETFGTRK